MTGPSGLTVSEDEVHRRVSAARQSLAGALHDEIGPLLFSIAARTQRARMLHAEDVDELRRTIDTVAERVLDASDRLRALLRAAAPVEPEEAVPAAIERDLGDLRERADIGARLVVRGRVRRLPDAVERTVLSCARQALFNVDRHATATTVIIILEYLPDAVHLTVADDGGRIDGRGRHAPACVPDGNRGWGFTSMSRQAELNGGEVTLHRRPGETLLRLRLPA